MAWAREMNAEEVIIELQKHGGIADKEWHGEKLELNNYKQQTEEVKRKQGIDNSQFEIEGSEGKNSCNDKDSNILHAFQCQQ